MDELKVVTGDSAGGQVGQHLVNDVWVDLGRYQRDITSRTVTSLDDMSNAGMAVEYAERCGQRCFGCVDP
jgi:hypothetical protein